MPKGDVRPTSERARQAFFNILGERVHGARFLDLFAGSGIFAFEAVSRGAASAVAVDLSRHNAAAIDRAAKELGAPVRTVTGDVLTAIKRLGAEPFDIVYADPPYDYDGYPKLLEAIAGLSLSSEAVIAVEHRRNTDPFGETPPRLRRERTAEYGEVWMTFFSPATG